MHNEGQMISCFLVAWFEKIWCLVSGYSDLWRPQKHCLEALGPAQLACPTCRRRSVCLSGGDPQGSPQTWLLPSLSQRKRCCQWAELTGTVGCHQGACFRRETDTGYAAFTRGHVVKVMARWFLPAHTLLISTSGTSVAPTLRIRLGFLRKNRIKGRMLKHMVLLDFWLLFFNVKKIYLLVCV